MPKFKEVPDDKFSSEQLHVLDKVAADGLTINASGDFKVGKTVVTGSEAKLVGGKIALGVKLGDRPVGSEERERMLRSAQGIVRKLGVDTE